MATKDASIPLFDHTHDALTTVAVVGFTALTAVWVSWLVADLGVRWPALALAAAGSGYLLYDRADGRSVLATGLYLVATLVVLTPIVFLVPILLSGSRPGFGSPTQFVLNVSDLQVFVVFLLVAAVPALVGYLVSHPGSAWGSVSSLTGGDR
jgi:hypothetical protein